VGAAVEERVAELGQLRGVERSEGVERIDVPCTDPDPFHHARRARLPDAVDQLQTAEPGQLVARVVEDPQQREQVAHVGRLEEP